MTLNLSVFFKVSSNKVVAYYEVSPGGIPESFLCTETIWPVVGVARHWIHDLWVPRRTLYSLGHTAQSSDNIQYSVCCHRVFALQVRNSCAAFLKVIQLYLVVETVYRKCIVTLPSSAPAEPIVSNWALISVINGKDSRSEAGDSNNFLLIYDMDTCLQIVSVTENWV